MRNDDSDNRVIENQRFDEPLVLKGQVEHEPERYVAEKPYELTKYEFSVLRRRVVSLFLAQIIASATAGILLAVTGKAVHALLSNKSPTIEVWELWSLAGGILVSACLFWCRTDNDKERIGLETAIDRHFAENRPRRVHLTNGEENET